MRLTTHGRSCIDAPNDQPMYTNLRNGYVMRTEVKIAIVAAIAATFLGLAGCSTTAVGAGVGAVGGAVLTGGSPAGVVGGAVVGGVIGHESK